MQLRQREGSNHGDGHWLPVFHTLAQTSCTPTADQLCTDPHFYYLASGCSDLYVHAPNGTMLVARNRADAVIRLMSRRYGLMREKALSRIGLEMASSNGGPPGAICGLDGPGLINAWASLDACAMAYREQKGQLGDADVRQALCIHRTRAFVGLLNGLLFRLLDELGMTTVVLLHEAPGADAGPSQSSFPWKTEIVRAQPYTEDSFFSSTNSKGKVFRQCQLAAAPSIKCLYCSAPADAQTPLARYACVGSRSS